MNHRETQPSLTTVVGIILLFGSGCGNSSGAAREESGRTTSALSPPSADLDCSLTATTDLHPPLTPEARPHDATTNGLTGSGACTGTINGETVTGTCSFELNAHDTDGNCAHGDGSGSFVLSCPTASGTQTVTGSFDFSFSNIPPSFSSLTGDLTGTTTVISADGDCVNTPLGQATSRYDVHVSI